MSNWNTTVIECSNPEVMKTCKAELAEMDRNDGKDWDDSDVSFCVSMPNRVPHDKIKEISVRFPDDVITCRYSFEYDLYTEVHIVEYRNGKDKEVDIEPSYLLNNTPLIGGEDDDAIEKKAEAFCRRLDTKETDKDGNLFINWFGEKVCYTFEHNSADGTKYKIEATKERSNISFKVYEGHIRYDWQEIDVPF